MIEKFFKRSSWTDIVISSVFLLFGILLFLKPNEMMSAISTILGIIFMAMGVLKMIEYFTTEPKEDYLLTVALLAVIFGVIILLGTNLVFSVFRVILGIWIIASGIMDFQTALAWKDVKSGFWTASLIFSMLMIIAGIIILVSSTMVLKTIGIITAVYAVLDIIDRIIFIKKVDDYL